ncbi:hypothetical protein [Paraflavitalea pollutisoli]|uniref:hypothetical protein n=1 Tax=Paraflavitalea pollutisoli TaxID=3034143 RepID=UPI0023ECD276|nr:hypothetical protein [Paraflavitalea sp. H1-2-19X]
MKSGAFAWPALRLDKTVVRQHDLTADGQSCTGTGVFLGHFIHHEEYPFRIFRLKKPFTMNNLLAMVGRHVGMASEVPPKKRPR